LPAVTVTATDADASRVGLDPGTFTFTRSGSTSSALTVNYSLAGTAGNGTDYNSLGTTLTIPAGAASATVTVAPKSSASFVGSETVVVALSGSQLRVAPQPVLIAQAVIGCMIARSIPPAIIGEILHDWPLFLATVIAVIAASSTLGWLLTRWRVLPGTTAVWGSSPGAASAMMLMASAYGADIRLVAFMQYLRVLFVALLATIVARVWTTGAGPAAAAHWFMLPACCRSPKPWR